MIRQYYKLEGGQVQDIMGDFEDLTEPLVKECSDLVYEFKKEFKIKGELVVERLSLGNYVSIGYQVETNSRTPEWSKSHYFMKGGDRQYYITPKKNWAMGKRFQWWLDKINAVKVPAFSSFVVDKILGGQKAIIHDMAMHYAIAGVHGLKDNILVLSVPTNDKTQPTIDPSFNLVQIKKSEYISITEGS